MSIKIERLNDEFQEVISEILHKEVKDPDLRFVTVTGCDITSDLSFCKVYFTVLNKDKNETLKSLKNASSFIRGEISKRIEIRHTPEIKFVYDNSVDYGDKIDKILEKIGEECAEVLIASKNNEDLVHESVDLIFHTLLLLAYKGISFDEVLDEFESRRH